MGLHCGGFVDPFVKLFIGIIPGAIWLLLFFVFFRRHTSSSLNKLFLVFGAGALATVPALLIEVGVESLFLVGAASFTLSALGAIFVVAPVEEIVKFVLLRFGILRRFTQTKVLDPILFGMAIGLGFATVENILLVFQEANFTFLVLRALTATLLHAGATGIVGFYIGLARKDPARGRTFAVQGVFIATLFHAAYNFIMTLQETSAILLALLLLVGMFLFLLLAIPELRKTETTVEEKS